MVYSMTAFGRSQAKEDWGTAVWELRSINHRYLEITVRLPEHLRELEQSVREIIHNYFQRGKVECSLRFTPGSKLGSSLTVNEDLAHQLIDISKKMSNDIPKEMRQVNILELLSWQGVVSEEPFNVDQVREPILSLFEKAAKDLKSGREREGEALAQCIQEKLKNISHLVTHIKNSFPQVLTKQREKIMQRLEEVQVNLDPQRLEQELVFFSQKIDVVEEVERTLAHIKEVNRTLAKEEAAGRRLDFMMQELNREANTIASKSLDAGITHAAVEMKVLIEQIREQVQNIE